MINEKSIKIDDLLATIFNYITVIVIIVATAIIVYLQNFSFLLPFYIVLGNLFFGGFVFLKGRRQRINISFSIITIFVALWTISVYLYTQAADANSALFWSRFSSASSAFVPLLFLYFTHVFPKEGRLPSLLKVLSWTVIAGVFVGLSFTNIFVGGVIKTSAGYMFTPGAGLGFFLLYYLVFMGFGFFQLLIKYQKFTGISRMQIRYIFMGFFVGAGFPVITNIILPLFGIARFSGLGPAPVLIALAFFTYAIVKHRLMSVELVLQRGLVYGIISVFIMTSYALAIMISERFFREAVGYSSFLITGIAALAIAILYQPILNFLQKNTDIIFFKKHYDYQKTLRKTSSAIASIIRLEQLTKLITSMFTESMAVSEISFLLYDKSRGRYKSASVELKGVSRYRKMEIDEKSAIISYLEKYREILLEDELESEIHKHKTKMVKEDLYRLKEEIERIGVPLWVPIISKDELVGVIASGNKLSGEIFTAGDFGLLSTIANQTAVALDNVRLYEEIVSIKTYNEDVLQSMIDGVLTTDLNGNIITFNAMAEKITGYKFVDLMGKAVDQVWHDGVISGVIKGTIKGGPYTNYEANLVKKDSSIISVSISTAFLRDNKGKNIGILSVIADLSEFKELEGKVRQADKLAALGTMAAGMAHEIKNPLSSMKVLSQLMPLKFKDSEFRKRFTEIMPREIGRIDRIVESLLGFARATAPRFDMISIETIIEETLQVFQEDIQNRKIKLEKKFAEVPPITADADQMSQVFSNLILNAIQAMPKGGELKILLEKGKEKDGVVETIKIRISDTGHGIPKEYIKKLFDPFFTTKHGGTGLGLTITHSIIDGHRGSIVAESSRGKGTIFKMSLPVTQ